MVALILRQSPAYYFASLNWPSLTVWSCWPQQPIIHYWFLCFPQPVNIPITNDQYCGLQSIVTLSRSYSHDQWVEISLPVTTEVSWLLQPCIKFWASLLNYTIQLRPVVTHCLVWVLKRGNHPVFTHLTLSIMSHVFHHLHWSWYVYICLMFYEQSWVILSYLYQSGLGNLTSIVAT